MYGTDLRLTKDYILSRISEEEIFQHYLGVPVQLLRKFCSPLRKDTTPTCSFTYDRRGVLKMRDFSGHFHGDCFNLVQFIYSCDFLSALEIIASDFNLRGHARQVERVVISDIKKDVKAATSIQVKRQAWTEVDKAYWSSFGIKSSTLRKYQVSSISHVWVNGKIIHSYTDDDPMYAYYFGDGKYKIYFPFRKSYRFLSNHPSLQGISQLTHTLGSVGDMVVVTKSMKDVMLLDQYGIPAVAPPGESSILSQSEYEDLSSRFSVLYSLYDFDATGVRGAQKMKKKYGIIPLFLTNGRFKSTNYQAKDLTDYYRRLGPDRTLELISSCHSALLTPPW